MSPLLVLPVIAVVLWLVHASLGTAGHQAYRYTRWVLFGGLAAAAAVFFSLAVAASRSVPSAMKDDSFAGVFEGVLALEALLVLPALALLEVIHVAVTATIRDAQTRAESQRSAQASSL
ncbi:putative membrane protein YkvI [Arthrobacter pascens]|uniref:hypothetical protein n=1 Tax=Arthrobacter pascens TaxID=1677 RepID=UPI002790F7EA|nr:hypothetical protein [Arthrobacter pascens]MDQ0680082.1 putative membrane protein YkvI [Arthrobacter pascens]